MRNLKKILALALALVMTLSLMTVANAFNDDSQIDAKYDEAVTVLSNLKVFKGVNDGSNFAPKQTITRAEVAAIIYRIVTGDVNDTQAGIYKDYAKFKDVAQNHWAAGYIGYCSNAELIVGDGTNFYPDQTVNGYQALAMILRAMGYDQNDEFKGEGWEIRVASTAQQRNLLVNINAGTLGTGASREMVAEILFQAITKNTVVYTPALGYYTSELIDGIATESLGYKTFGLQKNVGEVTAVGYKAGTTTLTPVVTRTWWGNSNDNVLDTANSVVVANTDADWTKIGYVAYAYTVPTAGAKTRTAVSDLTVTGESVKVTTDGTAIAPKDVALDTNVRYYYNGVECSATTTTVAAAQAKAKNVGVKVDYIDNDNSGKVEVIAVTEYTTAYVSAITNSSNTGFQGVQADSYYLSGYAVKASDLVCADTLVYGDLVTYVVYGGIAYVDKADLTVNTFTRINYNTVKGSTRSYVIGGAEYLISANDVKSHGVSVAASNLVSANLNKSFDVYTDPYGHILYAAPTATNVNYMFVLANDHTVATTGMTNARVVNTDGSIANVNIAKLLTGTVANVNDLAGHMYAYTVNADGSYNLVSKDYDLTNASYNKNTATVSGTEGSRGVNTATVVVDLRGVTVASTAATAVYTGYGELPTFTGGELHYVANNSGWVRFAFLTKGVADLTDSFVVYDTSANYEETVNGVHYYYLDVVVNGVNQENYQLTATEYNAIDTYGVGAYTFSKTGALVEYTAFPEEWTRVEWSYGSIRDRNTGAYYTYDGANVKFNVLNITRGEINNYAMEQGRDYNAYLVKNGSAVTEIYIVVGEVAASYTAGVTTPTQVKDNATYTYFVRDNLITGYTMDVIKTGAPTVIPESITDPAAIAAWNAGWTWNGDTATRTVNYEDWKDYVNRDLVITAATGNKIAVDDSYSFSTDVQRKMVTATEAGKTADQTQTIVVYSQSLASVAPGTGTKAYTFVITYAEASDKVELTSKNPAVATVSGDTITVVSNNLSINEFVDTFEVSEGAKVEWTFINATGIVGKDHYNQTMQDVTDFTAVVTAEDGTTTTYLMAGGATVNAMVKANSAKTEAEADQAAYLADYEDLADMIKKTADAYDAAIKSGSPAAIQAAAEKMVNVNAVVDAASQLMSGDVGKNLTENGFTGLDYINDIIAAYGKDNADGSAAVTASDLKSENVKPETGAMTSADFSVVLSTGVGTNDASYTLKWTFNLHGEQA